MTARTRLLVLLVTATLSATLLPTMAVGPASASPGDPLFTAFTGFAKGGPRARVVPDHFAATTADLTRLRQALAAAPSQVARGGRALVLALPTPEGGSADFAVQGTQTMESTLAAQHPEISTYAGRGLTDPSTTIAVDVTPMGLHASVRGPQGRRTWYLDPATNGRSGSTYLSYYGKDLPRTGADFVERNAGDTRTILAKAAAPSATAAPGGVVRQRDFRLALTSDPSYAAYFGTENVLAEKVTLINRVNQIYNDDLAIRMRLVNATDALNLDTVAKASGANGPCGTSPCFDPPKGDPGAPGSVPGQLDFCSGDTLARNRTVLGELVGAADYDIGHIVLGVNGGGVAYLGVTGQDYKGGGCTGLPFPEGDFMAIDYVAHEMGHQFGGNHTFNGCGPGNRNGATSVEPGGGSSVMAYAGICGRDDLQPHSDPYFSQRSIDEMTALDTTPGLSVTEVQTVSLRGFDRDGDTITLGSGPRAATITRGVDYTARRLEAVVERLTGRDVTISGWGYDPLNSPTNDPAPLTAPDSRGFQVIFSANPLPTTTGGVDVPSLTVVSRTAGVRGTVSETANGGPAANRGHVVTVTDNHAPVVSAPADRTIPLRTPFALTGAATDADGEAVTYLWEQNDVGADDRFDAQGNPIFYGGTDLLSNAKQTGPLFRVFGRAADVSLADSLETPSPGENIADGSPTRVFPDLKQVLKGNTNAATGKCPAVPVPPNARVPLATIDCYSEFLPTKGYRGAFDSASPRMTFRVTARDGYPGGGGTGYADVTLRIAQDAGPLLVRSQADAGSVVAAGSTATVRWAVNGTDAPSLAPRVRILLSTDGGTTFPTVLATVANTGSHAITWPAVTTSRARIKIEAVDNYFFAVNDAPFTITR